MKTEKTEAIEAIKTVTEARDKLSTMSMRRSLLANQTGTTDCDVESARSQLEQASAEDDSKSASEAREKLKAAKARAEELAEEIAAIDRATGKLESELPELLSTARAAHRRYWFTREQTELEKASAAADAIVAAYIAYQAATGKHDSVTLADYVKNRAALFGVTDAAVTAANVEDGVPVASPDEAA